MPGESTDFLDPAIVGDIRVLVMSEGAGVQLFAVPERFARRARFKQMWSALHELETQTRAAVFDVLGDDAARFISRDRIAAAGGTTAGTGLAVLPHRLQLHALVEGTRLFVPHFRKLADHFAGTPHSDFFDYVLAHELAIAELGRRALAHDQSFLQPVEALLGAVPN